MPSISFIHSFLASHPIPDKKFVSVEEAAAPTDLYR
jgi:hypothetical protein